MPENSQQANATAGSRKTSGIFAGVPLALALAGKLISGPPDAVASSAHTASRPEPFSVAAKGVQFNAADACGLGVPVKDTIAWHFGSTMIIQRKGYILEHSATDKIPLWVCEHVVKADVSGPLGRPKPEPFGPEPLVPSGSRAELKDYRGSGYDRGHQAPSGNQTQSKSNQAETYYLSNMAPQAPKLNQQIWKALEDQVRNWAKTKSDLYVITGPMFYDPKEESELTANGSVNYEEIGPDRVAVPTHFFKIVASPPTSGGNWEILTFVMENREYPKPFNLAQQLVSLKWLEDRTGLTFLPMLPADQASVKLKKGAMWP